MASDRLLGASRRRRNVAFNTVAAWGPRRDCSRPKHWLLSLLATCGIALAGCAAETVGGNPQVIGDSRLADLETTVLLRPYFGALKAVDVQIAGEPHTFLFDTGGGLTLITPSVAEKLGCSPFGRVVGYRMSGESVEFKQCERLSARVGARPVIHSPIAVFDLAKIIPPELPRLDGILSLDSFRGQVLTIDWRSNRLIIHGAASAPSALAGNGVPVRVATGENGSALCVLVPVASARGQLWFLLDSGNMQGTLISPHLIRDQLISLDAPPSAKLQIGTQAPEEIPVTVQPINYDGVLGTHYLQSHTITIDLRRLP